jgi:hypothetical protein
MTVWDCFWHVVKVHWAVSVEPVKQSYSKCLYCYKDFGSVKISACSLLWYRNTTSEYSLDDMHELALRLLRGSVSVPGIAMKLSMSILNDDKT